MVRRAPEPGLREQKIIAEMRAADAAARTAKPAVPAPPAPPYVSPEVEVLTDRLAGHRKGDVVHLQMTEGQVQALIEAGAIRLALKKK